MKKRMFLLTVALVVLLLGAACAPANNNAAPPPDAPGEPGVPGEPGGVPLTGPAGQCPDGRTGEELYNQGEGVYATACAQCHGQQGQGEGNFPGLVENVVTTGQDIPALVRAYYSIDLHPNISTEEAAAVFTYTRNAWGHQADLVCPEQISDVDREPVAP
jgi:mono/diheme cytochrome c family protein